MNPSQWGKEGWRFFHAVSLGYPDDPTEEDKRNYYTFYSTLQHILPCGICRNNEAEHFRKRPLTLDDLKDRESLVSWGIDHHNSVNAMLGKKILTKQEAFQKYHSTPNYKVYIAGGAVIIGLLLLFFYLKKK